MNPHDHNPERKTLLIRSLLIAGGLALFKIGVFAATNSMAILASAADSSLDFVVSLANFLLIRKSSEPADHNHPYGHGKIESVAGLAQSVIMAGVTLGIGAVAIKRFVVPQLIEQPVAAILITVVALLINVWHVRNLRKSMLETASQVMAVEYLHYASDTLVYVGVVASLVIYKVFGSLFWDPLISLAIVVYLLKTIADIFRDNLSELLDTRLPDDVLKEIDTTIRQYNPRVTDYHNLRTRKVGATKFIEFHVVLSDVETFREAHELTKGLMAALKTKYPGAVVTAHPDPEEAAN